MNGSADTLESNTGYCQERLAGESASDLTELFRRYCRSIERRVSEASCSKSSHDAQKLMRTSASLRLILAVLGGAWRCLMRDGFRDHLEPSFMLRPAAHLPAHVCDTSLPSFILNTNIKLAGLIFHPEYMWRTYPAKGTALSRYSDLENYAMHVPTPAVTTSRKLISCRLIMAIKLNQ